MDHLQIWLFCDKMPCKLLGEIMAVYDFKEIEEKLQTKWW